VDSFHALVCATTAPGILVFAHGFDIGLEDRVRLEAFLPGFRETAAAFGARPVLVATNLRQHSATRRTSWEKSHGGALAAVGHVLAGEVNRMVIPSSYPYHDPKPWGTHWDLDPLWSSRRLAVEHGDATLRRHGKIQAIADHVLVRRHLRVCWENLAPTGNCSRCEKCVRTMIALAMCDRLDDCEAFDRTVPIERVVDDLAIVTPHLLSIYEELRRNIDNAELGAAIDRLIARSQGWSAWWHKRVRRLRRHLGR
jgi:hypothetical protein